MMAPLGCALKNFLGGVRVRVRVTVCLIVEIGLQVVLGGDLVL